MFQKTFDCAGALNCGSLPPASNMSKTEAEDGFGRLRRAEAARKNRTTANCGMFYRRSRA